MRVYVCEDSFEGLMTAVYSAWADKLGHKNVRLELEGEYNLQLFAEYVSIKPDKEKTEKVIRKLRNISEEVFTCVYRAAMSKEKEKADKIYHFIVLAVYTGPEIMKQLGNPVVMDVFELARKVMNEAHRFLQFVRFEELENKILFSKIAPKSYVLTLIAPHFEDRLMGENWIIYDEVHKMAAVHVKNAQWALVDTEISMGDSAKKESAENRKYEELWKLFFHTIGIEARKNPKCQQNFLPLWYRKNMLEFDQQEK